MLKNIVLALALIVGIGSAAVAADSCCPGPCCEKACCKK
jgi:hypothetical protein